MRSTIPVFVGLVLVALLTLVCSCHVERDVQATADAALAAGGHDWATAEADGRWITLTGFAPTAEAALEAVSRVDGTDAVTRVDNQTGVYEVSDADVDPVRRALREGGFAWVGIERADRTLTLSGMAGEGGDARAVEDVTRPLWPWGPLDNRIRTAQTPTERRMLACRGNLQRILATGTIGFESGSSALTAADRALLNRMVTVLTECRQARIQVEAHTDNTGGADSNLTLSRTRAQSVVDYLVRRGLRADRFTPVGYGESRPVADNATEEGRSLNRRVEFRFSL